MGFVHGRQSARPMTSCHLNSLRITLLRQQVRCGGAGPPYMRAVTRRTCRSTQPAIRCQTPGITFSAVVIKISAPIHSDGEIIVRNAGVSCALRLVMVDRTTVRLCRKARCGRTRDTDQQSNGCVAIPSVRRRPRIPARNCRYNPRRRRHSRSSPNGSIIWKAWRDLFRCCRFASPPAARRHDVSDHRNIHLELTACSTTSTAFMSGARTADAGHRWSPPSTISDQHPWFERARPGPRPAPRSGVLRLERATASPMHVILHDSDQRTGRGPGANAHLPAPVQPMSRIQPYDNPAVLRHSRSNT